MRRSSYQRATSIMARGAPAWRTRGGRPSPLGAWASPLPNLLIAESLLLLPTSALHYI